MDPIKQGNQYTAPRNREAGATVSPVVRSRTEAGSSSRQRELNDRETVIYNHFLKAREYMSSDATPNMEKLEEPVMLLFDPKTQSGFVACPEEDNAVRVRAVYGKEPPVIRELTEIRGGTAAERCKVVSGFKQLMASPAFSDMCQSIAAKQQRPAEKTGSYAKKQVLTISLINNVFGNEYSCKEHDIRLAPRGKLIYEDPDSRQVHLPWFTTLAHEMRHAWQNVTGLTRETHKNPEKDTKIELENDAVNQENLIRKQLYDKGIIKTLELRKDYFSERLVGMIPRTRSPSPVSERDLPVEENKTPSKKTIMQRLRQAVGRTRQKNKEADTPLPKLPELPELPRHLVDLADRASR